MHSKSVYCLLRKNNGGKYPYEQSVFSWKSYIKNNTLVITIQDKQVQYVLYSLVHPTPFPQIFTGQSEELMKHLPAAWVKPRGSASPPLPHTPICKGCPGLWADYAHTIITIYLKGIVSQEKVNLGFFMNLR